MSWTDSISISTLTARISLAPSGEDVSSISVAAFDDARFLALWHGRMGVSSPFALSLGQLDLGGVMNGPILDLGDVPRRLATGKGIDIEALVGGGYTLFYDDTTPSVYEIPNSTQTRDLLTSSVLGRRYDASDIELTQDFTVNGSFTYIFGSETRTVQTIGQFDTYGVTALPALQNQAVLRGAPSLAASADGGHWLAHVEAGNIQVLRFSGTSIATPDTRPLPSAVANIVQSAVQSVPQIAELTNGDAVLVWQEGVSESAIRGRILNADGSIKFTVNIASPSGANERTPQVAALADGRFVVVWNEILADFSDSEIMARLYSANGQAEGDAFRVNTITSGFQSDPDVVALPDGGFAVVWQSQDVFGNQFDVKMRRFATDGTPINDRFLLGEWDIFPDANSQLRPSVSVNADGQMIVGWLHFGRQQAIGPTGVASARLFQVEDAAEFFGTGGNDVIGGQPDGDRIMLLGGDDVFNGDAADDLVRGDGGNDTLSGADGNDWLNGGEGNDVLNGGHDNDTLMGGLGRDLLDGEEGDDLLLGGGSADTLIGGTGHDTLQGEAGTDTLVGGTGDDVLFGGTGADFVQGGDGEDQIFGGSGGDTLEGGAQNDSIEGGSGRDLLFGGSGDDLLFGGSENDTLFGGSNDDRLDGGSGNDLLGADSGADTLIGGAGNDTLTGGSGADVFVFAAGFGSDVVTDFQDGTDRFDVRTHPALSFSELSVANVGGNATIQDGLGNAILVLNAAGLLDAGDFLF